QDDTAVPTYDEITATKTKTRVKAESDDEDDENQAGPSHPWGVLEEDEFDEKAEEFETQYNFRYEEPYVPVLCTSLPLPRYQMLTSTAEPKKSPRTPDPSP
ncbi:UNVERIFIED_CONTAM: hypothetical protein NY603_19785, partial [Bacteroidetes bacterium 56_B9]